MVVSEGGLGTEDDIESSWMDVNGDTKNEGGGDHAMGEGGSSGGIHWDPWHPPSSCRPFIKIDSIDWRMHPNARHCFVI